MFILYNIEMSNQTQTQIVELISRSQKVLVLPSSPPDGDSIGSAISFYMALKKLGKDVTVICSDAVPEVLQFLPNTKIVDNKAVTTSDFIITLDCENVKVESIKSAIENNKVNIIITPKNGQFHKNNVSFGSSKSDYDLVIVVDTAELNQLGNIYQENPHLFSEVPVINIDHHVSNTHFGKINYVDIMASSATELILPILEELSKKTRTDLIDEDIATLLLTGIITDTGSFQNANTTPRSFSKAAELIAYGARQQEIIQHIYKTKQLSQLKLWGRVLSKIETDDAHRIVWSVVSQQDFRDTESSEEQTGDVIDELMTNAPGAEVVLLIREKEDGTVAVSVRTTSSKVDGSKIAEHFGGGGHTQAAGFRIKDMDLKSAEYTIIKYVKNFQAERLGLNEDGTEKPLVNVGSHEPMINVEELLKRAKDAQNATSLMPTPTIEHVSHDDSENKKSEEDQEAEDTHEQFHTIKSDEAPQDLEPGVSYRFED